MPRASVTEIAPERDGAPPADAAAEMAVLGRIAVGDRDALAELYAAYQRPLFRYLCQLAPDRGLAEEILQDTLVAVWASAGNFEGRSAVRTWVFAIARRQAHKSGVALALLPRPIRRSDVVLGKWLGWGMLVGGYTIATTGLEFMAVHALVGYTPPYPLQAMAFLVGEAFVMLSLALLCSTRLPPMTGGIVALALFGLAWMGGIAHAVGTALESDTVREIGLATSLILPTDGLWRGALFHLEPSVLADAPGISRAFAANPFFALAPPSAAYIAWAIAWIAIVLGLAIVSFERREI